MIKMQRKNLNLLMLMFIMTCVLLLTSCFVSKNVEITSNFPDSFETSEVLNVDFKQYITIKDVNNPDAKVTDEMLDVSNVNYKKPGLYVVKIKYVDVNNSTYENTFVVKFTGTDYSSKTELKKLNVPSNITAVDQGDFKVLVSFTKVSTATEYLIKIYDLNDNLVKQENVRNNQVINVGIGGNYYLTIQSLGDNISTADSDVSNEVYFFLKEKSGLDDNDPTTTLTTHETHLQNNFSKLNDGCLANGIPSLGTPKILVVPIEFSDYTLKKAGVTASDIEKGFFGTSSETGWESLSSYYEKSSYGYLKLSGTVLPTYTAKYSSTYYNNLYTNNSVGDDIILKEVLDYYDKTVDFSEYDYNNDGFIDGIYLVYAHPQDYENDNLWWAWQNWATYMEVNTKYDGVRANYYMWASAGFILEGIDTGDGYDAFDYEAMYDSSLKINMHTFIHETGHMFGLDDYYDYPESYSVGPAGGLGGADIMDYTVGDHCPFSKMMLGWVNPTIVMDSVTIKIRSFTETGECIMIPKNFTNNGYFGEYLTIDLYTPTGLNALDADNLFTKTAVRIMQVDATFNYNFDISQDRSAFMYNNSDTSHKQIRYIEANGKFDIEQSTERLPVYADNNDLFDAGDYFEVSTTMWKNLKWYDGSSMNFRISIDSISNGVATITITKK